MTNEEMQRTMEFILNQQAQITANIQKLQESQAKGEDRVTQIENLLAHFAAATVKRFEETDAKINALIDAQMRTDEAVRNLTAVVDRYFRERNGG
jgi:uncharacterized protein YPO0396